MAEVPAVNWLAASIGSAMAVDKSWTPEQNGVGLFQAAYEAWVDGRVDGEWTASGLEVQSGWEEARRGQQQRSSLIERRGCYW